MSRIDRRTFLGGSVGAAGALSGSAPDASPEIVDTHVYLSRWPFRRMDCDETPQLVSMLRRHGVVQAWAGTFDALLCKNLSKANERLARDCQEHGKDLLLPFGAINPKLPDWEEDLRRCHEQFRMKGVRVHPNYHNYTLRDPDFVRLFRAAAERGVIVQMAAWMEDERTQNPLMQVRIVDASPLAALLEQAPAGRVMVLNAGISATPLASTLALFRKFDRVAFDFAMLEGMAHLPELIRLLGVERVALGSYSPMFYFESAALKLREGALPAAQVQAVLAGNARRLLA